MKNAYSQLVDKFTQLSRIEHAITFLTWDQQVMMPPKGNRHRGESVAELTTLHHALLTAGEVGDLLGRAREEETDDPEIGRSVAEMQRVWQQASSLPADLVRAKSLAGTVCEHSWRQQRKDNDWHGFLTNFREVVALSREEARARQASAPHHRTPYDALLDLYCTGDSSEFIDGLFGQLKKELPQLLARILEERKSTPVDLAGNYPLAAQQDLGRALMGALGFDFEGGRIDVSAHPFSTGGPGDQRITSRYTTAGFTEALMATAHETGHAAYESGLPERWLDLPVGKARNMCLHESQSLLFEKQIFLSAPFFAFFIDKIHAALPDARRFSAEQIREASGWVQPSLVRVDADEVTYPLHVILRYEIERDLINGAMEAEDIPERWHAMMSGYLGLSTLGNYRDGCLQDIHWTDGSFGYFPSYTLGALNSVQLFAAIKRHFPDWQERFAVGDIGFVRAWLKEHIWEKASTMDSQDIIAAASGEGTNPQYFFDHLRERYLA